jgi:peptidoglycan hydrolase-like protein with peptidoglycan-binding domain
MRVGDRGLDVQRLQETLNQIGYDVGRVDGVFGSRTDNGVRRFQRAARLTVDGLVGPATRAAMKTALGSSAPSSSSGILREGDRGDQVHRLQDRLKSKGFPPGPIDGVFGPRTLVAVISFQKARNLRVDGLAGPQTQKALGM